MEIGVFSYVVSVRMFTYEKFSIRRLRGEIRTQCCFNIAFKSSTFTNVSGISDLWWNKREYTAYVCASH